MYVEFGATRACFVTKQVAESMFGVYGSSRERSSVPAPTIVSIIIIAMNVKTLIINICTISLIHTSSINDIQYNIIMIRYIGRAVVTTM